MQRVKDWMYVILYGRYAVCLSTYSDILHAKTLRLDIREQIEDICSQFLSIQ